MIDSTSLLPFFGEYFGLGMEKVCCSFGAWQWQQHSELLLHYAHLPRRKQGEKTCPLEMKRISPTCPFLKGHFGFSPAWANDLYQRRCLNPVHHLSKPIHPWRLFSLPHNQQRERMTSSLFDKSSLLASDTIQPFSSAQVFQHCPWSLRVLLHWIGCLFMKQKTVVDSIPRRSDQAAGAAAAALWDSLFEMRRIIPMLHDPNPPDPIFVGEPNPGRRGI